MDPNPLHGRSSRSVNVVAKAVAGFLLVIIVPMEALLQNNFEYYGGKMISNMQEQMSSQGAEDFFSALNYIGNNLTQLLVSVVIYHTCEPTRAIKFCVVTSTGMYLASVINIVYAEPRPYWVYGHISTHTCNKSFATPSYHLVVVQMCAGYILVEFTLRRRLKAVFAGGFGALLGLLYFGELYLGNLFPHQIAMTLVFCYVYLTGSLMADQTISQIVRRSCFNYRKNRLNVLNWYLVTLALLLTVVTLFAEITLTYDIDIQWIKHATSDCDFKYDIGSPYSFFNSAFIFFQLGIVAGSMFLHKYFHEQWWHTQLYKRCLRAFVACGCVIGLHFLFALIPSEDTTTEFTFNYVLPYYIMGLVVTLPLVFVSSYIGLVSKQYRIIG